MISLAYTVNADGTVKATVSVVGNVSFVALDCVLSLPAGATNATARALSDKATVNLVGSEILCSYADIADATRDTALFELTFKPTADTLAFSLSVSELSKCGAEAGAFENASYTFVGGTVKVK